MIRLPVIALALVGSAVGSAALAQDLRPAQVPAGKMPAMRAAAPSGECRGAPFVPAGKINTYGPAAVKPRCDSMILAANEARPAPAANSSGRD